ncbi:hypothetical protein [Pseudomonas sp. S1Bt23]|uniref:hypothetical protein n=1 Tax=Pseudomonas sp. S1Bt23 TaxID=3095074 RepID=UPI002A59B112|nr:hypothetical protein [Pseudomonas sp. S1Bt23]WPO48676.1 hypothetical protein SHB59_06250 [Pseudomonas sp. S1Bt23]
MATINVGKCRSLIEIESILSKIENSVEDDKFIFSLDSLKARHSPMHDASRLQMVVTLARQRLEHDYLEVHPNISENAAIEEVCSYSPGIAGVRLTRGIRLGQRKIDRRDALIAAVDKMQATDAGNFADVVRGRSLDMICVAGSKVQYLKPLFSARGRVKEHVEMIPTIRMLIDFVTQQSRDKVPNSLVNSLGLFTTELMKNTQEHAVIDHAGKPYLAHVEGMMLGWTRFSEELFADDFKGNTNLESYWKQESNTTESGLTSLRAFEVSYFDSGPGLVSRFTGVPVTEMSRAQEREALLACLQHKATSKSEHAAGEGLPSVLRELRKIGGLMRIRSGRLSMFNAFCRGDSQRDLFQFENWTASELAPVQGAVVSILVPLRAE